MSDKTVYFGDHPEDKVYFGRTYYLYYDDDRMIVRIGGKPDGTVLDIDEKFNLKDVKVGSI